jgi:peroxisomal enoyl-CoA hydratase 2
MATDKSMIGKTGKPFTMPIEWSKVREFARAIKDHNPLYFDLELARKECGGIPVPPTFLQVAAFWQDDESMPSLHFDLRRILHGEQEFEFDKPILVGDVLTGTARVADIYEREGGRGGKMTFLVMEIEYKNQKGDKVAVARSTLVETGKAVGG